MSDIFGFGFIDYNLMFITLLCLNVIELVLMLNLNAHIYDIYNLDLIIL